MNPYRESAVDAPIVDVSARPDDEGALAMMWAFVGCILVGSDMLQTDEPWGVAFSLGMLVLLAIVFRNKLCVKPLG